jgi:hypothetical protein
LRAWTWPYAGVTGTLLPASTICWAKGCTSGSSLACASASSESMPGKKLVASAHWVANFPVLTMSTNSHASSWSSVVSKTDSSEPPVNDGLRPAVGAGDGEGTDLALELGGRLEDRLGRPAAERIIAASPRTKASRSSVSFQVVAAGVLSPCSVARPV